jgi:hypothetical protein
MAALDIDGFAILRSIADHSAIFPSVAADAAKAARTLVVKQIKSKTSDLKRVRDIRNALGVEAFSLILDGIPDAQIKTLLSKLDKHHPELKTSNAQWRRQQLGALLEGSVEPSAKPPAPAKRQTRTKKTSEPSEALERLDFKSAGAIRKR